MPAQWFISDLHFSHQKVAEIRGFDSTAKHDLHIARKWEKQVHPDDTVWVLGDISRGSKGGEIYALDFLGTLPGRKHLIAGNHDSVSSIHRDGWKRHAEWLKVFESIQQFQRIRVEGHDVLLSHYPYASQGDGPGRGEAARYAQYRLPDYGGLLVHGHTHHTHPTDGSKTDREMCVSWDAWDRMVNYGDISQWVKRAMERGLM